MSLLLSLHALVICIDICCVSVQEAKAATKANTITVSGSVPV